MKDNDAYSQGWVESQYYPALAQYFVKYLQAYAAQGVPVNFVTVNNEPTCCAGYPSTQWNGSGLQYFTKTNLLPALHSAGLSTKVLALDWNWDAYDAYAAPSVTDSAIRDDPNFGGMAWHGYGGDINEQDTVHNQYPSMPAYETEHSGGTWIANQQAEDMANIIDYTRHWGQSVVKWSLAVDQNMGPHNGGCGTCTGLVTVHNDGSGRVDYTVEYYDMGQLTKFVKPGAVRIASNDTAVRDVAWRNPDGSKALVAYNGTGASQQVRVNWGGESFSYTLPAATSATFTWTGTQSGGGVDRRPDHRPRAASAWTSRAAATPTAPRSTSTTATARRRSSGPPRAARCRRSASASTSSTAARPTAPSSSCGTAPAPRTSSSRSTPRTTSSTPRRTSAWT